MCFRNELIVFELVFAFAGVAAETKLINRLRLRVVFHLTKPG
jgi:hypothetical protein